MHYHHTLLVNASDEEEAITAAECFIEPYGDGKVWDFYEVGARWAGLLDGENAVNGKHKNFFKFIEQAEKSTKENLDHYESMLRKKFDTLAAMIFQTTDHMDLYYLRKWAELKGGDSYASDTHFYDTTDYTTHLTSDKKKQIEADPKSWWLVGVDLHN